ncbi:DUF5995 family protein [Microscilla marina]|uniref:Uncharacterized protein n=1 Tax=Microscilla marina ATCC 23134 TaxID=313606 RepID=A1ZVM6_MICM2|nr:DUF5995 family protein [Microscilla marina]EAY25569.1 conserved hypothetical protein [Microscilla marina ATCC 23134]
MKASTIDEVITQLDDIINVSKQTKSPLGYFAALYQKVTIKVKEGIAQNFFEDGTRMEKLDVIFANRYLTAYYDYQQGKAVTQSWQKAFALASRYWPIVLQHLLMGMNAHINLDLGIAAAEVSKGHHISDLKDDFSKINQVLSSLVHEVQNDLATIWPTFRWLLKITGKTDQLVTDFSMQLARDGAWKFAQSLVLLPDSEWRDAIKVRDKNIAAKAHLVSNPGLLPNIFLGMVRLSERGSVGQKIAQMQ